MTIAFKLVLYVRAENAIPLMPCLRCCSFHRHELHTSKKNGSFFEWIKSRRSSKVTKLTLPKNNRREKLIPEIRLYIDFGGPFLLLFWASKKVRIRFNMQFHTVTNLIFQTINNNQLALHKHMGETGPLHPAQKLFIFDANGYYEKETCLQ
jgi:hypothetical protein